MRSLCQVAGGQGSASWLSMQPFGFPVVPEVYTTCSAGFTNTIISIFNDVHPHYVVY